jgi:hypothetical protein
MNESSIRPIRVIRLIRGFTFIGVWNAREITHVIVIGN